MTNDFVHEPIFDDAAPVTLPTPSAPTFAPPDPEPAELPQEPAESAHSDTRRTLVSLVDQAVFAITTFGTGVLIGRLLLEAQFSLYYLAMTMFIVMGNIQSELVTAPYSVYRQQYRGRDRREYAGSVFVHQLCVSCLSILPVIAMLGAAWMGWVTPALTNTLLVMLAVAPVVLLRAFVRSFSFASYRFTAAIWIDLSVGATQFCGLAALWALGALSVAAVYAVMGAACLVGVAVWRWTKPEPMSIVPRRVWQDWKRNWVFSRWALASQLTGTTSPYIVPWVLEAFHGQEATGLYGACFTLVGMSMHFVTAIGNYLTPRSAAAYIDGGAEQLKSLLWRAAGVFGLVIGAVCLGFVVVGDWPVRMVYGEHFGNSSLTCVFLAAFTLSISMSVVTGIGLWAVHLPKANMSADLATMIVTITSAFALIPWLGKEGAAAAMLTGALTGAIVRTRTLRNILGSSQSGFSSPASSTRSMLS